MKQKVFTPEIENCNCGAKAKIETMNSIICIGHSGTGKSTWTKQFIQKNPSYITINRDSLRTSFFTTLDNYYTHPDLKTREEFVSTMAELAIYKTFLLKKNVIIDATNLQKKYLEPLIENLLDLGTIQFKIFEIDKIVAKQRVLIRDFGYTFEEIDDYGIDANTCKEVAYIDKQYTQYQEIKEWIKNTYVQNLIENE